MFGNTSWAEAMLQFAHPMLTWTALAVPLLVWLWMRRRGGALRFSATGLFAGLPRGRSRTARWGGALLRGAAFLSLALALAGPRWPDLRTRIVTEGIALVMVVDVSGSMAEVDFDWAGERISRLEAAKRAFTLFVKGGQGPKETLLEGRRGDLVGLVTFATRPESACPLTLSHDALLAVLEQEAREPRSLPTESQTNIGDAIAWGLHRLASAGQRRKVMILLSDGEHNVPPPALRPRQAAQLAANLHVPVYTLDAGGETRGKEGNDESRNEAPAETTDGERTLQTVARMTGG
jgi:Ca-activated chloride channel family protein